MKHLRGLAADITLIGVLAVVPAASQEAQQPQGCTVPERPEVGETVERGLGPRPLAEVQREVLLRIGPSRFCEEKYLVPAGATVELQDCGEEWCLVTYGTEAGYLHKTLLTRVPNRAADEPIDPRRSE
ncbi:hypothetical protein [Chelativorans sp. AA-79]|uniref:hypothetical protein n=1 Tax=Chelativorans sp. AA-79 TaxID=3028735 RepID=UPI0023F98B62|nr:hypothetical protein [Chelativorans sp. AA-79]WEX10637.1 hypothetical protein PVE73_06680 [Chelativorans sp. AA-79]